jgi:hypothetical protein
MTEILYSSCNAGGALDSCQKQATSDHLRAELHLTDIFQAAPAPRIVPVVAESKADPVCSLGQSIYDNKLVGHIDAFTHGRFSGQGITQKDVADMLHSGQFTQHERAKLRVIDKALPDVAGLFKTHDVSKAKMGAFLVWSCPAK